MSNRWLALVALVLLIAMVTAAVAVSCGTREEELDTSGGPAQAVVARPGGG